MDPSRGAGDGRASERGVLWSHPFAVLLASTFLFFLSFQLLLPVVPLYAVGLGGREADVGLVIGVFAFSAMLLRPVAGWLADAMGRLPLVLAGALLFAASSIGYAAVAGSLAVLFVLRFVHGAGMGLGPTAATVMAADLAPPERRGEAMGLFGIAQTGGMAVGPYLGAELHARHGFTATFAVSAILALGALLLGLALPETRPPAERPGAGGRCPGRRRLTGLFSAGALYPSLLVLALFVGYGGLVAFLPIFAAQRRLGHAGLFFTAFALAVIAVRPAAGRLADRVGRRLVLVPGLCLATAGLGLLAGAASPATFLPAAVLYGLGFGAGQPALMAMTTDRVPPDERGQAMGTLYTAWELGISGGSVLLGLTAARFGYAAMWGAAAAAAAAGALAGARGITRLRG